MGAKRKNKKRSKIMSALALGMLVISGGALAIPSGNDQVTPATPHIESVKPVTDKPGDFIKINNLAITKNFDYFDELNKEFREKTFSISPEPISNSVNEGAVIEAINKGDFDAWKKAVSNLEGVPNDTEQISEEDFNILVELHKQRSEFGKSL